MNPISILSVVTFGFVLGLKHAIEADHVAAVSTIVSEHKKLLSSALVGALWGLGHTVSLMIAGVAIILLHIRFSERFNLSLEFCVGLMLIVLGLNALRKLAKGGHIHFHQHEHGQRTHAHPHIDFGSESVRFNHHGLKLGMRPLVIGMIHGLAGSAALMLLVLSTISQPAVALIYVLVFGIGSTGGMVIMSALVGLPAQFTAKRFKLANAILRGVAAVFSLLLGLFMTYEIGFSEKLFG